MNLITQETCPTPDYCTIVLTKGLFALIDQMDYERISKHRWHAHMAPSGRFYAIRNVRIAGSHGRRKKTIFMHREVMDAQGGVQIDHVEHVNTLDNRRSNLRHATFSQNGQNKSKRRTNKSGFKGVHKAYTTVSGERWIAQIQSNGVHEYLGTFTSPESAYKAYCDAARERHGEFARF